jgi:hypothetical protein
VELAEELVEQVAGSGGMAVPVFSPLAIMPAGRLASWRQPRTPASSRRWPADCS